MSSTIADSITQLLQDFSERHGNNRNPQLMFKSVGGLDILALQGWDDALPQAIAAATKLSLPSQKQLFMRSPMIVENKQFTLLPVGVNKYRLLAQKGKIPAELMKLPAKTGIAVPVSDSYGLLRVNGTAVTEFLKLLFTINTEADVFVAGRIATTAYHHQSVTLHRSTLDENFYILHLPSGTAESLTESMLEVARQFRFAPAP